MQIFESTRQFEASRSAGNVSAILLRPETATALLVLGHGAGAGMRHSFMESLAHELARNGIACLRYQFPYMEQGKRSPNPQPVSVKTVRSAVAAAAKEAPDLPLFAGGKSYGGRMTSTAAATEPLPGVRGIVFFGFPLHAPGQPSSHRAEHLSEVSVPVLFLQGTRDKLADLNLLKPVCDGLGERSTLHIIEEADHSFSIPKRTGRTHDEVIAELAQMSADWFADVLR